MFLLKINKNVTHYLFIKKLYMDRYFICKKKKWVKNITNKKTKTIFEKHKRRKTILQPIFYPIFSLICEEKNLVKKERKHPILSIFPLKILPTKHSKKINFSFTFLSPFFIRLKSLKPNGPLIGKWSL